MVFRKKKDPSFQDQVDMQKQAAIEQREFEDADYGSVFSQLSFDTRVLIDERVLAYFGPDSKKYHACYQPLEPFCSPALATGRLTEDELRRLKRKLNRAKAEAFCLAEKREHYFLINSLVDHIWAYLLGSARHGFKLMTLTENRKTLRMINEGKRKKFLGIF